MAGADLETQLLQSTEQAKLMTQLAEKGLEGLTLLEQALETAEQRLGQEVIQTQGHIADLGRQLQSLELSVNARDKAMNGMLAAIQERSDHIETDLQPTFQRVLDTSKALADQTDAAVTELEKKLHDRVHEVEVLRAFAHDELGRLHTSTSQVATQVKALAEHAAQAKKRLETALTQLQQEHHNLDNVTTRQLENLTQAYKATADATGKRLNDLETHTDQLTKAADQQLHEHVVRTLGVNLRKAADSFAGDLLSLEQQLDKVVSTLSSAHKGVRDNMNNLVIPGMTKIAGGLHNAASQFGWV